MKVEKVKMEDLISPSWNPREMPLNEMEKLKKSIEKFGYVEPIIVNKHNNHIVGGNQRYEALRELGHDEIDVVYINEPDINREKALNVALNKISGEFDDDLLKKVFEDLKIAHFDDIELTGFDDYEINEILFSDNEDKFIGDSDDEKESKYTDKIDIPHYEITGKKPTIDELLNHEKTDQLQEKIKSVDLPKDVEEFLILSSYRFLEFDYENIAEYYAHGDKKLQEIMEELVLVIIDYDKAIEKGLINIRETLKDEAEKLCQNQ